MEATRASQSLSEAGGEHPSPYPQ